MSTTHTVIASTLFKSARAYLAIIVGIQLVAVVAVAIGNGKTNDPVDASVWEYPGVVWIRYPLLGFGAALVGTTLVPFLANGVTRRTYLRGASMYAASVCAIVSVAGVVGYGVERAVYAIGGWETDIQNQSIGSLTVTYVLLFSAYILTGSLLAGGYMRWSPYRATWMITPFLVPMVAAEVLLGTWWSGVATSGETPEWLPLSVGAPLVAIVLVVAAAVVHLLVRDVALRPKKG